MSEDLIAGDSVVYNHLTLYDHLSPVHTSNNVEATGNKVACCFDNVALLGNNVEATFDFVERTKFQRKTRSTLLPFLATKSNIASTLLLVWTGLKSGRISH